MSSRLDRIRNWEAMAIASKYSASTMAQHCGISLRQLRWYFKERRGLHLKKWLDHLRAAAALQQLQRGDLVKAAAIDLYFKQPSHFSKFLKRVTGSAPTSSELKKTAGMGTNPPL